MSVHKLYFRIETPEGVPLSKCLGSATETTTLLKELRADGVKSVVRIMGTVFPN